MKNTSHKVFYLKEFPYSIWCRLFPYWHKA